MDRYMNETISGDFKLSERNYGKSHIKVLHVNREGKHHSVSELEVDTRLTLRSQRDFLNADNRDIVATDSQKNIVYVLAKKYGVKTIEDFGMVVAKFFLTKYEQVVGVRVTIEQYPWHRMRVQGRQHNHAFLFVPTEQKFTVVQQAKNGEAEVTSGLRGLRVLKTTQSSFTDFTTDEFRTLPDSQDRIFSTVITSNWTYSKTDGVEFDKEWEGVRNCILEEFAGNPDSGVMSQSVQHTLYLAQTRILQSHPNIDRVEMDMPNKHYWDVDMSKFPAGMVGREVNKTVFTPVDKPSGLIHAVLHRQPHSKL